MKNETTIVTTRIDASLRDELEKRAREDKRTISNYLGLLIEKHLAEKQPTETQLERMAS